MPAPLRVVGTPKAADVSLCSSNIGCAPNANGCRVYGKGGEGNEFECAHAVGCVFLRVEWRTRKKRRKVMGRNDNDNISEN